MAQSTALIKPDRSHCEVGLYPLQKKHESCHYRCHQRAWQGDGVGVFEPGTPGLRLRKIGGKNPGVEPGHWRREGTSRGGGCRSRRGGEAVGRECARRRTTTIASEQRRYYQRERKIVGGQH